MTKALSKLRRIITEAMEQYHIEEPHGVIDSITPHRYPRVGGDYVEIEFDHYYNLAIENIDFKCYGEPYTAVIEFFPNNVVWEHYCGTLPELRNKKYWAASPSLIIEHMCDDIEKSQSKPIK